MSCRTARSSAAISPSVELPFHQQIYKLRPDLSAVLHAHPPALVAFSNVSRIPDTHIIPNVDLVCGRVGFAPLCHPGQQGAGRQDRQRF